MDTQYNSKLDRLTYVLHPGEYHATGDPVIISTVLGSCIAVVLFDSQARIGGMNHFLLPGSVDKSHLYTSKEGRYGLFAMELLINQLLKLGAQKHRLKAKVFGGAKMFKFDGESTGFTVSESNVSFAFEYLKTEGIPVVAQEVGNTYARKVLFLPDTSQVFLKGIRKVQEEQQIVAEEKQFLRTVQTAPEPKSSEPDLF
ncbi:chemotaxis protein CheD [Spirochaeta dissipatitropha]